MRGPIFPILAVIFSVMLGARSVSAQGVDVSEREIRELSRAVREDDPEALEKLRALAESGVGPAQLALGSIHSNAGKYINYEEGAKWNLAAAKQGLPVAQINIGFHYTSSNEGERDLDKAIFWFQMAADQGHWMGAGSLGNLYRGNNPNEPGDFVQAYRWYTVAMRVLGDSGRPEILETVQGMRSRIAEKMTMTQVAEAEILAAQWVRRDWSELEPRLAGLN